MFQPDVVSDVFTSVCHNSGNILIFSHKCSGISNGEGVSVYPCCANGEPLSAFVQQGQLPFRTVVVRNRI